MSPFIPILGFTLALLLTIPLPAQDQTLVPERDWTSADGKVLRASLVGFEKGQGQFRSPEGRRFVIPDDRLSLRDQVEVFVARLQTQFDESHSADINTDFYYSKHIPASRRFEKHYSYVAFGPGRFNLAIALIDPGVDFSQFKEIAVRGAKDVPEVVYPLRETDIRRFTRNEAEQVYARISFVTGQNEEMLQAIEAALSASALTFVARGGNAAEQVLVFDEPESNGLREALTAYRQASKLVQEGFLKRDRLVNQTLEAVGKASPAEVGGDPLEPFRKSLSQKKYGALQWKDEVVEGLGFLGTDVVVRRSNGEIARAPFAEISEDGRQRLFEKRQEEAFGDSKHEYRAGVTVFLPRDWDSRRMDYSRSILLTLNQKGEYMPRLFAWAGNMNGTPVKEIFVRGDIQEVPFLIATRPGDSYTRDRTDGTQNTLVGTYLNTKDSEAAFGLIGSTSIQFRLRSDQNQDVSVTLEDDELAATLESIALFQWSREL